MMQLCQLTAMHCVYDKVHLTLQVDVKHQLNFRHDIQILLWVYALRLPKIKQNLNILFIYSKLFLKYAPNIF